MLNLVANGPSGYTINNSLRFRSSASAYLNRTFTSSAGATTWTWSGWVKRGSLGVNSYLLEGYSNATNRTPLLFTSSDTFQMYYDSGGSVIWQIVTNQVFRDPSAWYHIVLAYDSTQATAANRVKLYVNGSQVTSFSTATYPTLNQATQINTAISHYIGAEIGTPAYFDGYMAEVNFIDGQALTPSSFGSTNSTTGVWQPAKYTGTYGTNGFYLNFNSIALTSGSNTGLGKDNSGNGNYWNTNNISVTSGTTYDAMTDVPTLTSATVANYAVMSPIMAGGITVTDGNLSVQKSGASYGNTNSTISFPTSGKYYFEATIVSGSNGNNQQMGMGTQGGSYYFVLDCYYSTNLIRKVADGTTTTGYGTASAGTVIGVAVDADNGKAYLAINNTWIDSSSPTGGTGGYSMTSGQVYSGFFQAYNSGVSAYNFGQRPFSYTPPTGFVALNTYNLPTSTIVQGNKYMDATLYTGNGSTQSITNTAGFKPDLVWVKSRSAATDHKLTDSVRGVTKALISDTTGAETTDTNGLTAFNSNGWSLGTDTNYNNNTATYVGWQWQAGQGSTSSNTSGSITSTVSVNASAGFSIVTYTGTGANATVGHGLGVAPKMVITKNRGATSDWAVWHTSLTSGAYYLLLDTTAAQASGATYWNSTIPTSSVFSVGTATPTNVSTNTYVAYCWAEIAGFSKFGSYTANASTDGPFVYCGFRPKYILIKGSVAGNNWVVLDTSRSPYNVAGQYLLPNSTNVEGSGGDLIDIVSNGFKIRDSGSDVNYSSGATYIYAAFAENPFRNSLAR